MSKENKDELSEEELAVRAAAGDDHSMALLISKITPVARAKASGFGGLRISNEDLAQEGMLGFLEAVKTFCPQKGVPFRAYAEKCINNRIVSAVRSTLNNKNAALTNAVSIEDGTLGYSDSSSDPANIISAMLETEYLRQQLETSLSEFEKKVVSLRLRNMSYSDIAHDLGCTEKSVDNAMQRIRKKMRNKI